MKQPANLYLYVALCIVAVVWGTTYLSIRIAVHTIPPWYVTGIRQSIAASLILAILLYRKEFDWIGWKNLAVQIVLSVLMIVLANGMTTVAEKHISSSLTSLLTATSPLLVFLGSSLLGMERFTIRSIVGLVLGFSGVVLVFSDGLKDLTNPSYIKGILILFVGIIAWATGTLYSKTLSNSSGSILLNLFYQFAFAAVLQLFIAHMAYPSVDPSTWSTLSLWNVVYLGVFGSVVAYYAFLYAIKRVKPSQLSTLSYLNTIIAVFLGWAVLDERISTGFIFSTALIIAGVFLMNYRKGMFKKQ